MKVTEKPLKVNLRYLKTCFRQFSSVIDQHCVNQCFGIKQKYAHSCLIFCYFCIQILQKQAKTHEKEISTSIKSVQHQNAGQNIQHIFLSLFLCVCVCVFYSLLSLFLFFSCLSLSLSFCL